MSDKANDATIELIRTIASNGVQNFTKSIEALLVCGMAEEAFCLVGVMDGFSKQNKLDGLLSSGDYGERHIRCYHYGREAGARTNQEVDKNYTILNIDKDLKVN